MTIKYNIIDCIAREGVYRAIVHVDGVKYSKDYSKHSYNTLNREAIESELLEEVWNILKHRIEIERGKRSL